MYRRQCSDFGRVEHMQRQEEIDSNSACRPNVNLQLYAAIVARRVCVFITTLPSFKNTSRSRYMRVDTTHSIEHNYYRCVVAILCVRHHRHCVVVEGSVVVDDAVGHIWIDEANEWMG